MVIEKINQIIQWCKNDQRVCALLLVGSYAKGNAKIDSDIDLVLITQNKESLFNLDWIDTYGQVRKQVREEYGVCTSIRVFYDDNTEIEYGIVNVSWLDSPLDAGTRHVLENGYKLLVGKNNINDLMIQTLLKGE